MEKSTWFILGNASGILLTFVVIYVLKSEKVRKLFHKESLKDRNNQKLSIITFIIFLSYALSLVLAFPLSSMINKIIGIFFFLLVILLGFIAVLGIFLVRDNYEYNEEGSQELSSLGESLVSVSIQLLLGSITLGILLMIITIGYTNLSDFGFNEEIISRIEALEEIVNSQ